MFDNDRYFFSRIGRGPVAFGLVLLLILLPVMPISRKSAAAPVSGSLFVTLTPVASNSTVIPGGTGTFLGFPYAPSIDAGSVALVGTGTSGQQGVYRVILPVPPPIVPPNPVKVADLTTAIPGGTGNFTGFAGTPVISGDAVAFLGMGSGGQQGIYHRLIPQPPPIVPPNPIKVADLLAPIPSGTGNFTGFLPMPPPIVPPNPTISGNLVAFYGTGNNAQEGIYISDISSPNPPPIVPLADTNTEVPGGNGNFTRFTPSPPPIVPPNPTISGNYAVFYAEGIDSQRGIYLVDVLSPNPPPIIPVADVNTAIPGGFGSFTFFSAVASENNDVTFVGGAVDVDLINVGVYKALNVLGPVPPPIKVADIFTAVPGGIGNFTSFGTVAIDPGTVVFEGYSEGGTRKGLYTDFGGTLSKLVATGDTLNGKTVSDMRFGPRGFNNHQAVFAVDFSDGTQAVFMATLSLCSVGFSGFHSPIGGADATGGTFTDPVRAFRLGSTVPVKMRLTDCDGQPLAVGVHTIQTIKFSNATTSDAPIDATPTDAATTGNQFRLTNAAAGDWHFNLSTTGLTKGIWQIKATLSDNSTHTAFIELK